MPRHHSKPYDDIRILILEDNLADKELMEFELRQEGFIFHSKHVQNKKDYIKALRKYCPDIILSDHDLPDFSGTEALQIRKEISPETPFILVTGAIGEERAIEILTGGATDYVLKKNLSRLLPAVGRALHESYKRKKHKEAEYSAVKKLELLVQERTRLLQQNEHLLKTALENSNTGIWVVSPEGDLKGSPQLKVLFGHPSDSTEMEKMDFYSQIHPDDVLHLRQEWENAIGKGEIYEHEFRVIWPDGSIHWLAAKGRISPEIDGQRQFIGTITKITERKQAEEALKKSERRLRLISKAAKIGLFEWKRGESEGYWSPEAYDLIGCDPATKATREQWDKRLHPDDLMRLKKFSEVMDQAQAGTQVPTQRYEYRVLHDDGAILWLGSVADFEYENGNLIIRGAVQDITERKEIEDKLRKSEARQAFLLKLSDTLRPIHNPSELQRTACTLLGEHLGADRVFYGEYHHDEGFVLVPPDYFRPGDKSLAGRHQLANFREVLELLRSGRTLAITDLENSPMVPERSHTAYKKIGARAFIAAPLVREGKLVGTLTVLSGKLREWTPEQMELVQEVGERTWAAAELARAEESLGESEERFRVLVESTTQAVWETDAQGVIVGDSLSWRAYTGQSLEEWIGNSWSDAVHPDDREKAKKRWRKIVKNGSQVDVEFRLRAPNGGWRWTNLRATPIRHPDGTVIKWVGMNTDITERKEAENALHESENRFRLMADGTPVMIWVVSASGRIDFVNKAFLDFSGIPLNRIQSQGWLALVHPEDRASLEKIFSESIKGKKPFYAPARVQRFDGEWRWVANYGQPRFSDAGEFYGMVGSSPDITESKMAEIEREKLISELATINKELESFSYSVSHDLRAPLRAIDGFSSLLLKTLEGKLDKDERRRFNLILDSTKKMYHLIDDLLALSRIGRTEQILEKVDMNRLAESVWQQQLAANPDHKIDVKIGKLPSAIGDEGLLRQVFLNLLANAVKFTKKRKKAIIEMGSESNEKENIYYVKDNGTGFDMKYYDKLFGVFQRLHLESEYEGTGVGLAIVQRIIHRHGGRVWTEGKAGKGATFYFSLKR
jgi:PAS domain S-box-containing protein